MALHTCPELGLRAWPLILVSVSYWNQVIGALSGEGEGGGNLSEAALFHLRQTPQRDWAEVY